MYATGADSASLSITGDITLEGNFKIESLPAAAASYTLMSKWNGDSDERSYSFDLVAASGYFGDGSDGALTISSDTTCDLPAGQTKVWVGQLYDGSIQSQCLISRVKLFRNDRRS
jgi:hypothetical protein